MSNYILHWMADYATYISKALNHNESFLIANPMCNIITSLNISRQRVHNKRVKTPTSQQSNIYE